ncbi:cation-transporting P-type ATPase [Saccharomonospora cyanea]|uniref:cation-transporting P-type ATPase n=1 Tax=Saccharomonospora cyanea TaxID=40989 RepID=UPI0002DBA51D|nr:cation-transporting P-type ATPase [Saccharomonospora cyanea]
MSESDPRESVTLLLRDPRSRPGGLPAEKAARRLEIYGPNELRRKRRTDWPRRLARQFTRPLPYRCGWPHRSPWCPRRPRLSASFADIRLIMVTGDRDLR